LLTHEQNRRGSRVLCTGGTCWITNASSRRRDRKSPTYPWAVWGNPSGDTAGGQRRSRDPLRTATAGQLHPIKAEYPPRIPAIIRSASPCSGVILGPKLTKYRSRIPRFQAPKTRCPPAPVLGLKRLNASPGPLPGSAAFKHRKPPKPGFPPPEGGGPKWAPPETLGGTPLGPLLIDV